MDPVLLRWLLDYFLNVPLGQVIAGEVVPVDIPPSMREAFDFFITLDDMDDYVVAGGVMQGKNELMGIRLFTLEVGPWLGQGPDVTRTLDLLTQNPRFSQWRKTINAQELRLRELEDIPFYFSVKEALEILRMGDEPSEGVDRIAWEEESKLTERWATWRKVND